MGFRLRKTFKVIPGVRMTVTPRGVSTSVGGRHGRVSVHSSGRVTNSASIPGTGLGYVSSKGPRRATPIQSAGGPSTTSSGGPPKRPAPGPFSPRWEKELFKAVAAGDVLGLYRVATTYPEARLVAMTLDGFMYDGPDKDARARGIFEEVWNSGFEPLTDRFLNTYVASALTCIEVAPGIGADLALSRDAIGLALVELRQEAGDLRGATDLAESLEPSTLAAVSLAELYGQQGRWQDVIDITNGLEGNDDFTIFLLTQRGIALREMGFFEAARESFKAALARRSQPVGLKHRTLVERSITHLAEGKRGMARRDLEKVLAENATYPGLQEALASLAEQ